MKWKNYLTVFLIMFTSCYSIYGQSYGLTTFNSESFSGYTLFSQLADTTTYLIDNCGNVVHKWEVKTKPGNSQYLLEDGSLLRCGKDISNAEFNKGGQGGIIEIIDWQGNYLWEYTYSNLNVRQHHDIAPLPNGNILVLAWEKKDGQNAVSNGRDPSILSDNELWPEHIVEIEPIYPNGGNIVWEWHIWNHLIQDFDNSQNNFGVIEDHPELMNINAYSGNGGKDWLHGNSIDYNESLDQIMLSFRALNEIIVIDHSTTILEAASHSGGNSNQGGDILYRWGNPNNYGRGSSADQKLFGQHDVHWIDNGLSHEGKIQLFNNQNPGDFSSIGILFPPENGYNYDTALSSPFLPDAFDWEYQSNPATDFYSSRISGSQMLPNNNILICEGTTGRLFEINDQNDVVWEYEVPIDAGEPVDQNTTSNVGNSVFRVTKYPIDYAAFTGEDLSSQGVLELNATINLCDSIYSSITEATESFEIYPNPSKDRLNVITSSLIDHLRILSLDGKMLQHIQSINTKNYSLLTRELPSGAYLCVITLYDGERISKSFFKD